MDGSISRWFDREIAGCSLADRRLTKRLRSLLERMGDAMGASIPLACQDWANTKAAYRFFSNQRISEAEILAGHFDATRERFAATEGAPLGLAAVKFWTREKFKGTVALKKKINPTRVPIEGKESTRAASGAGSPPVSNNRPSTLNRPEDTKHAGPADT